MKTNLIILALAVSVSITACGGNREETDDKDSIEAVRSADSMLQNELNADTSASSLDSVDTLTEDNTATGSKNK
ncbi:hypothetical protein BDE36_4723 [Arcticibacter tournemirensis]|uniref:Uncharacterized protein n=1 Tax=Arcticibacter tournemirensis TaxID=699437 RepID=A0A5M9HCQ6_9SPHI|nr:hypothetical protein [Arcticibacter tournemirensis]KAA8484736.1 hypothetical protein F1649_06070 [Arcticibacter tournemirensis]TQM46964.1 hypothetical protein BDE36_4723 [Arcticibacter tournemirensis]